MRSKTSTTSDGADSFQESNRSCHAACHSLPRSTSERVRVSTSSGTAKWASGSKPSTFLVAATSSSPRAEPCDFPVPWALGAGHAMTVCSTIRLGRSVASAAARTAA